MARQSKFSEEQRKAAVRRAFGDDTTPSQVAAELGVSVPTLYRWAQGPRPVATNGDDAVAEKLARAAQELLQGAPYPEITVEDVARRAGVPLRTAFARFPSKRELFGAAVDRAAQSIVDDTATRAEQLSWPEDPVERLSLFFVVNSSATYDHPESHVLFRDLGVPIEDRFAERWHDTFRGAVVAVLREASAAGRLRPGLDVEGAGALLARALRGIHVAVFDGVPRTVALEMVERLPLLVIADE